MAIITLILILLLSLLITRIATIALTHTGLSRETAKFQARSAFTGVGFTTTESERVVKNPVRRKILLLLMLLGNAGIVTGIATLIIGFTDMQEASNVIYKIVGLAIGITGLWALSTSKWFDRKLYKIVTRVLRKRSIITVTDFAGLLQLGGDYRIAELGIDPNHWLNGKKVRDSGLSDEGIIILAITRENGAFMGAPQPDTSIFNNDSVIVYGRAKTIEDLDRRMDNKRGERRHEAMVKEQKKVIQQEKKENHLKETDKKKSK